jgi:hypothetical protein
MGEERVCYGCRQTGHIHPNCPNSRSNPCAAPAWMEEVDKTPAAEAREQGDLMEEDQVSSYDPPNVDDEYTADTEYPENLLGDYETVASHYWDDNMSEHNDQTVVYRAHAVRRADSWGSRRIYAAQYVFNDEVPSSSSHSTVHAAVGIIDKTIPPMYDHWMKHKNTTHHKRVCNDDATLLGFFEINGTKAHCLFNSGGEALYGCPLL